MKKFIINTSYFIIPFLLLVASYFYFDPFFVLRNYQNYGSTYLKTFNRNKVSTDEYLYYNPKYHFKSFIFGSSRTSAFTTQDWSKYISDKAPFHFDAYNEGISGIIGKMNFINKNNGAIKNALILIDDDTFEELFYNDESIMHLKDPRWSNESKSKFHITFFKSFFIGKYFLAYYDVKLFHKYRPYMKTIFKNNFTFIPPFNDFVFQEFRDSIKTDSIRFYKTNDMYVNADRIRNAADTSARIKGKYLTMVNDLKNILTNNKTNYKIIISPRFINTKINSKDLAILKKTFGSKNVYDYSGSNNFYSDMANYYDYVHFKTNVGRAILKEVYHQ